MSTPNLRVLLIGAALVAVVLIAWPSPESGPETEPAMQSREPPTEAVPAPGPTRNAIDNWLINWSAAQAASVRETCKQEPGCDPSQYRPEARPATSFGWDGAEHVEQIADWANGPRYWVTANGRRVLLYLEADSVVGAYVDDRDGTRRRLCHNESCTPDQR